MFLHLHVGDLKLHKVIKDSKHLKLSISIDDDNKQSIFSDNYLLNNIISFNQNLQFNLQNEPYQLIELKIHLLSIQTDGITEQEVGFKTIQCFYNALKSLTITIDILNNNGILIGNIPITYFYYKTAINPKSSLTLGQYQPNIQEYSFLLSRKIRNPQKAKPVSFNPDIEQRINSEVLNQNQRELLLARRKALGKDTNNISSKRLESNQLLSGERSKNSKDFMTYSPHKNNHRNHLLHLRDSTFESRHKNNIIKKKEPPKLRNTSMSVGYVKNMWPEGNEGNYERKMYRLQTAQEMKLQILKDIAQELQVRNQRNSSKNDFILLRKRTISSEEELRMKRTLRNKESEVKLLKNTLSHLRFNNAIQANESASKPIYSNFDSSISNIAQEILNSSSYRIINNLYPKNITTTSFDQKKILKSKSLEIKPTYHTTNNNTVSRLSTSHAHPLLNKVPKNTISIDTKKVTKKSSISSSLVPLVVSKKTSKKLNNYDASRLCDKSKNKMNSFLNSFTSKKDSINTNSSNNKSIPIKQNTLPNRSSYRTGKHTSISNPNPSTSSSKSSHPLKYKQGVNKRIACDWLAAARTSLHQLNQNPIHKQKYQSLISPSSKNKIRSKNKNREYNDILSNYVKQLDEIVLHSSDEESYKYMKQIKDEWNKIEQFDDSYSESVTEDISDSLIDNNQVSGDIQSSNSSEDSAIQVDYSQIPGYNDTRILPSFLNALTDDEFFHDNENNDEDQSINENILKVPIDTNIITIDDNNNNDNINDDVIPDEDIECKIIRESIMNEILFDNSISSLLSQDSLTKQIDSLSTSNEEINSNHNNFNLNNSSSTEDVSQLEDHSNFTFKLHDNGTKFITKKLSKKDMILNQFQKNRKYNTSAIQPKQSLVYVNDRIHNTQLGLSSLHSKTSLHQDNNNNLINHHDKQQQEQEDINLDTDPRPAAWDTTIPQSPIHHNLIKSYGGIGQEDLEDISAPSTEVQPISFENEKKKNGCLLPNNKTSSSSYVNSGSDVQVLFDDFSTDSSSINNSESALV